MVFPLSNDVDWAHSFQSVVNDAVCKPSLSERLLVKTTGKNSTYFVSSSYYREEDFIKLHVLLIDVGFCCSKCFHTDVCLFILFFRKIKREVSTMKLVRHPNIVQLYEVNLVEVSLIGTTHCLDFLLWNFSNLLMLWQIMASKSKIYFVLEYVSGGELFNRIVRTKT